VIGVLAEMARDRAIGVRGAAVAFWPGCSKRSTGSGGQYTETGVAEAPIVVGHEVMGELLAG
jgi:hypothetical protein